MKVLAAIDIMNGDVVRLTKGDQSNKKVYSKDPVQVAKKWEKDVKTCYTLLTLMPLW